MRRTLQVQAIALLVEASLLKLERVEDVVDLLGTLVEALLGLFGGSIGTGVYIVKSC